MNTAGKSIQLDIGGGETMAVWLRYPSRSRPGQWGARARARRHKRLVRSAVRRGKVW